MSIPNASHPATLMRDPCFAGTRVTMYIETLIPLTVAAATTVTLKLKNTTPPASSTILTYSKSDMDGIPASVVQDKTMVFFHFQIPASPNGEGVWEYQWVVSRSGYDDDFFSGAFRVWPQPVTS